MMMKRGVMSANYGLMPPFLFAIKLKTLIDMSVWCLCAFISVVMAESGRKRSLRGGSGSRLWEVDGQSGDGSVEEEEESKERQGNDEQRRRPSVHNNQTEYGGGRRETETVAEEWESLKALMEAGGQWSGKEHGR